MDSEQLFKVLGPNKIWLSADARGWAREWNMSDEQMARFLLQRSRQSDAEYGQQAPMAVPLFLPE